MATLDVVRGFAILGILIVNMSFFSSPFPYLQAIRAEWWTESLDRAVEWGVEILAQGKFYTMFSFLFGLGMFIFMERAQKKGFNPVSLFSRRLVILLFMGMIHAIFIWSGDILLTYSLLGFLLIQFRNLTPRKILKWAITLILIPILLVLVFIGLYQFTANSLEAKESIEKSYHAYVLEKEKLIEHSVKVYRDGSFIEITKQRVEDVIYYYSNAYASFLIVLAMFLFGLYAGRKEIFYDLPRHLPLVWRVWRISLVMGIVTSFLQVWSEGKANSLELNGYDLIATIAVVLSGPALCFFYITSIILLMQHKSWHKWLKPFAAVGRTAISNYLFQSFVCTFLFYSYGFGLYAKVGPAGGILISVSIYLVQLLLSTLWLRRFRFGPVEWIWRRFTYGKNLIHN